MTPMAANTVAGKLDCEEPCSTRYSPTKLLSSGRPIEARVVIRKTAARFGAARLDPIRALRHD